MCDEDLLIRGKPKTGWKSNIHTYFPFDEYFPDLDLRASDENDAKEQMIRHYLSSYGPVSVTDISWWTGFAKGDVKRILDALKKDLVSVEISGISGSYFMLLSDYESLKSIKLPTKPQVHLMPALDPYLMGFKDRQRFLDDAYTQCIYDRSGNATYSILIDGRITGVWDWVDQKEPEIKFHLFAKIGKDTKKIVTSKATLLGHFIFDRKPLIKECASMIPLNQRTMGGFMSPLKVC
jgi:hypothetical protein